MKRIKHISLGMILVLSFIFLSTGFLGCDMILPPEELPELDNPGDPESPDTYIEPNSSFVSAPAEGSTINTSTVNITYASNADLYQTKLDDGEWSAWTTETSSLLEYLDEGSYTFSVRAAYDPGDGGEPTAVESTPAVVTFMVDAVSGPALRLSPLLSEVSAGTQFNIEIIAEEVDSLMAVKVVLEYDHTKLTFISKTDGPFLAESGGSLASYWVSDTPGTIEINIGTAAGSPPYVGGTGTVATIRFRADVSSESNITFVQQKTEMRNHEDRPITITNLIGAKVRVP